MRYVRAELPFICDKIERKLIGGRESLAAKLIMRIVPHLLAMTPPVTSTIMKMKHKISANMSFFFVCKSAKFS